MEYKKASKGFIVEFNEDEEKHFEMFVENLKKHDDFSSLSSNSEFFGLIINEGVSALQQRTTSIADLDQLFANLLNEGLSAVLQYNEHYDAREGEFPISLEDLLSLLPNFNTLDHASNNLILEGSNTSLTEPLNNGKDHTPKNID